MEIYSKGNELTKGKEISKIQTSAIQNCAKIPYKVPFAWSMIQLFNPEGDLIAGGSNSFKYFIRQSLKGEVGEQSFLDMFGSSKNVGLTMAKKNRIIPAECSITITEIDQESIENYTSRYDPHYQPLKPFKIEQDKKENKIIREILEFPTRPNPIPHLSYYNTLFVYPLQFSLSKPVSNYIVLLVDFLQNDDSTSIDPLSYNHNSNALNLIYGKSNSPNFVNRYVSSASYSPKVSQFSDEIKIELPADLNPKHHLLFTFKSLFFNDSNLFTESVIGYSFLPLFSEGGVCKKNQTLNVYSSLQPNYLSNTQMQPIDKATFQLHSHLSSSIYTQNTKLKKVIKEMKNPFQKGIDTNKISKSMLGLANVKPHLMIRFLPIILNQVFKLMCTTCAKEAFSILTSLLCLIQENIADGSNILLSYAENIFGDKNQMGVKYVHNEILKLWCELSKMKLSESQSLYLIRSARFLFEIIFKSMVIKLENDKKEKKVITRSQRFDPEFLENLQNLLVICAWQIQQLSSSGTNIFAKELNRNIALFCRDLFTIVDRGFVFQLISTVLREMSPRKDESIFIELKLDFVKVLSEYKYWIPLNLPLHQKISNLEQIIPFYKYFLYIFIYYTFYYHF